jgi:hypothetical protein
LYEIDAARFRCKEVLGDLEIKSSFRPTNPPDPALLDNHRSLLLSLERRGFIRGGVSLGALTMLTGCDLKQPESVNAGLRAMSAVKSPSTTTPRPA